MSTANEPEPRAANVIEALARVQRDLPGIPKNTPSGQGYTYRGIEAITAEAQGLFGRHCVVFVPKVLKRTVIDLTINNKPWTQDEMEVVYTVYGPGGIEDRIEVGPVWGLGRDNSDKGANKAMTQALKYAMLQSLCISDAKDDGDRESHATDARPAPDPDAVFHGELVARIGTLDTAAKAELRQWCEDNGCGNIPKAWTPQMDRAVANHLDHPSAPQRPSPPPAPQVPQPPAAAPQAPTGVPAKANVSDLEAAIADMDRADLVAELTSRDQTVAKGTSDGELRRRLADMMDRELAGAATEKLTRELAGQPTMLPSDPF